MWLFIFNIGVVMKINIYSKNATYQKFEVLKTNRNKRFKYGEFLVEGVRNINQAIKNNWEFVSLIYSTDKILSDWAKQVINTVKTETNYILTNDLMQQLSGKEDASEIMAIIKMRNNSIYNLELSQKPLIVLFDRPSNKGNLGAIIRSCDAYGVDALIVTGHSVDIYDPEVIVAGMGSFFNMHVYRMADNSEILDYINHLKKGYCDFCTIATTAHKQTPIYEEWLNHSCMLMLGNETDGLCKNLYGIADKTITIPMAETSSASSFNVACAATTMIYEIVRQRNINSK